MKSFSFKWLSILHFVWGGYWLFMVLAMISSVYFRDFSQYKAQMKASMCINPPFQGEACDSWVIMFIIFMLIFFVAFAVINLLAAWSYKQGKPYTVNWVAASINLIGIPIGTVLGIYSLWRLNNYLKELQKLRQSTDQLTSESI